MFKKTVQFIKELYPGKNFISLHEPLFIGNEKKYINEAIDSTFVSSVGAFVDRFEIEFAKYVGAKYAVVTVNGTSALHAALHLLGVTSNDEVLTQALTFVATTNAIHYCGAIPVFIDSDSQNLGMSCESLEEFLKTHSEMKSDGFCYNKRTLRKISACVPMHVFGHSVEIDKIIEICRAYNIQVVEDAAESLGSYYRDQHTGTFAQIGVFSFNGNKILTSGGGGMIVTNDSAIAKRAKHITTTAKIPHPWNFNHDEVGFNYRMPNLNAALAVAQLEKLSSFVENKRQTAELYKNFFNSENISFLEEPLHGKSNYWLNGIFLKDHKEQQDFLKYTNENGVMTRPAWTLMSDLPMYHNCFSMDLKNAKNIQQTLVNIPSSVRI